jgi:protein kinase-like protein
MNDRRPESPGVPVNKTRLGPFLAAVAVLALTAGAVLLLVRLDRSRASERVAAEAQAAALRAADGVRSLLGNLEGQTQNATANPRLVAALDAHVDQETLRDLLLTEPWWEPFRRTVDGFGLYGDEGTALVTSRLPGTFDARTMVRDARQGHHASSGLLLAAGQVLAVAACPVALTGRSEWPVLVSTRILDVGLVSGMAERAGGAVAISDGRRLLVAATTGPAGGADDLSALKQAIQLQAPGLLPLGNQTVAALPLSGGLRVLVGVAAPTSTAGGMPLPWSALAILLIGITFSVGLFLILSRYGSDPPIAALVPAPGPDGSLLSIGRYTIVERIGQGGMAEIYSAVTAGEGSFRRPVVIKRLRPELTIDVNAVAQFCDEANLLAALHHPNIVAVHDFGRSQNQYFLAEEYIVGRDLGRLIERRFAQAYTYRPPPVEVIAYVGVELLKGLEYAHGLTNEMGRSLGIVHRDVSPENVMVSARGEVKLLDFGVYKASEGRVARTEIGVVKGNVTYMAPEQARGLEVDARADLYSLALVLFAFANGTPLYAAETTYALLMKAGAGPGVEDRSAIRDLPRPLAAVIDRATATQIEDRYPNARAMSADLEAAARNGAAATAALVVDLFAADLKEESHRMATFSPHESMRSAGRFSA